MSLLTYSAYQKLDISAYLIAGAVLCSVRWGRGQLPHKPRPCPHLKAPAYRCKKECSVAFKIRQNAFSTGALPRTLRGAHDAPPDPSGERTPLPIPDPTRRRFSRIRCSPHGASVWMFSSAPASHWRSWQF